MNLRARDLVRRGWRIFKKGDAIVLRGFYHSRLGLVPGEIVIEPSIIRGLNYVHFYLINPPRALIDYHPSGACLRLEPSLGRKYRVHWDVAPTSITAGVFAIEQRLNELYDIE